MIFFIYLYQRYIYRVDPRRVNEYGTSAEMIEEYKKNKDNTPRAIDSGPKDDATKKND